MKRFILAATLFGAVTVAAVAQPKVQLKTEKDSVSYAIGIQVGMSVKQQSLDLNADVLFAGYKDAVAGGAMAMTPEQMQACMAAFQERQQKKTAAERGMAAEKNKKEGVAYLEQNKKKKGVIVTKSGLQYEVLKEGSGPMPGDTNSVSVHYKGTLVDGTVFDSSIDHGQPVTFQVNGVIAGWTEALKLMKVGSKYRLVIPSELAYGEQGTGPIGPNAVLIFEVELLKIN